MTRPLLALMVLAVAPVSDRIVGAAGLAVAVWLGVEVDRALSRRRRTTTGVRP